LKLSIIIPTFNSEKTLDKCLNSVLSQTYPDFEVWLIDGLSKDNTIQIVEEYAKVYPNFHYVSEQDKGIYDAMNIGITLSSGRWLYFLGSDDYLINEFVLRNFFEDERIDEYDMAYGSVIWGETNKVYDGYFDWIKLAKQNLSHQAVFYKREVLVALGGFSLKYPILADYELNLKLFNGDFKILYKDVIVAFFSLCGLSVRHEEPFRKELINVNKNNFLTKPIPERVKYLYFITKEEDSIKRNTRRVLLALFYFLLTFSSVKYSRRNKLL